MNININNKIKSNGNKNNNNKVLNLKIVRNVARSLAFQEVYCNEKTKVISFARNCDYLEEEYDFILRINVYWTTGTVGMMTNPYVISYHYSEEM
eukprot:m.355873 g.355873  ORF g.355873 m.355873 type:complete len:94 (+) comp82700_c0_seq1:103-384(+)